MNWFEKRPPWPLGAIIVVLVGLLVICIISIAVMENSAHQFCQENGWQEHIFYKEEYRCRTEGKLSQSFFCNDNPLNYKCYFVEENT